MAKWTLITALILILSGIHIQGSGTALEGHLLHQQLFFIPIILSSFWFKLRTGLIIAIIISCVYISSMFAHMTTMELQITVYSQISLYILIAALIGWWTNRLEKQQQQTLKDEQGRYLTQLATALSAEIYEIVQSFENKHNSESNQTQIDPDFKEEINKLKRLTQAFKQISPPVQLTTFSSNVNEMMKDIGRKFQQKARQNQVNIVLKLDPSGCSSMVINDTIVRLIGALLDNAIDASPRTSEVILKTTRKGTHCLIEIIDDGHGVTQENIGKLFTPFFTTKQHGHGLSLAAGKKVMLDYGGDLLYEQGKTGGAIFRLVIPRENIHKNIDGHISDTMKHIEE